MIEFRTVPAVITPYPNPREIDLALRVPYFGKEANDFTDALPELQAYLKSRYPEVQGVEIRYRNPRPDATVLSWVYLHEAWIIVALLNPFTQKFMSDLADDAYKWLKKRFRIKKGHGKRGDKNHPNRRWVIVSLRPKRAGSAPRRTARGPSEYLLLSTPAHKLPIFTTKEKAIDFLDALRPIIDKSLPVALKVKSVQWHGRDDAGRLSKFARDFGPYKNPNGVVFDPLLSEAEKAVLSLRKPPRIIRLAAARQPSKLPSA